jgi:hypothetical protein
MEKHWAQKKIQKLSKNWFEYAVKSRSTPRIAMSYQFKPAQEKEQPELYTEI